MASSPWIAAKPPPSVCWVNSQSRAVERDRVLVGGLGLGYTVAEISAKDVGAIDVVEIEQCLIDWAYQGITATLAAAGSDPRVQLHAADIRLVFAGS